MSVRSFAELAKAIAELRDLALSAWMLLTQIALTNERTDPKLARQAQEAADRIAAAWTFTGQD